MISEQLAARRAAARAEAMTAYWRFVPDLADGAAPPLDELERVLSTLGVAPGDLDFDVGRLRFVRSVRGSGDLAAAQARLADVKRMIEESAAAEARAVAARAEADRLAAAAVAADLAASGDVERALNELKRGDALRQELLDRGCPADLAGEPLAPPPPPPRPLRRWRARECLYDGVFRRPGDVFSSSEEFRPDLAEPAEEGAVSAPMRKPYLVTQPAGISLRPHGSTIETHYSAGQVCWLEGDIMVGGDRLQAITFEQAAEIEQQRHAQPDVQQAQQAQESPA